MQMHCPIGYQTVEHDDGRIHAVDLDTMTVGLLLWRNTPVCGMATGPSSDEAGRASWRELLDITCLDCISVLYVGA